MPELPSGNPTRVNPVVRRGTQDKSYPMVESIPPLTPPTNLKLPPRPHRFFADVPATATGHGERTQPASASGWSYHPDKGWTRVDSPLAAGDDPSSVLPQSGYDAEAICSSDGGESGFSSEVYVRQATSDFMVVVSAGHWRTTVFAQGLPALLTVMGLLQVSSPDNARQATPPTPGVKRAAKKKS